MLRKIPSLLFFIFAIALLVYLALPAPKFPTMLWDFRVSEEPADKESPLRRGYYTNLTREQLIPHYREEFGWGLMVNHPPEEAQVLIRDQTLSSFLEEIVHPMRESLFVNGFEPKSGKPVFEDGDMVYKKKVIIKYAQTNVFLREAVGIISLFLLWILSKEWVKTLKSLRWNFR